MTSGVGVHFASGGSGGSCGVSSLGDRPSRSSGRESLSSPLRSLTFLQFVRRRRPLRRRWWRRAARLWFARRRGRLAVLILGAIGHPFPLEGGLRPLSTRSGRGVHFAGGGVEAGCRGGAGRAGCGGGRPSLATAFLRKRQPTLVRVRRWGPLRWRRGRRLLRLRRQRIRRYRGLRLLRRGRRRHASDYR